jgi:outer membrane protein OmpA-like peptidoglycan-associated protein
MTRQQRHASVLGRAAAGLLVTLTACAHLQPPPARPLPQPRLAAVEHAHVVHFATDRAVLSEAEASALADFLATLPEGRRQSARVIGHADRRAGLAYNLELSRRRAATVASVVRNAGFDRVAVTVTAVGEAMATASPADAAGLARDRQVEVLIAADEVVLPGCPDWSREPGYDPLNLPLSNLGCANAVNLGLMVADPGDLATTLLTAPADGTREADAVARYRTDKVRQLEADIIQ